MKAIILTAIALLTATQPALSRNLFDIIFGRHETKSTTAPSSSAKKSKFVSSEILVNASPKTVFETVHLERDCAPNLVSNNLLQSEGNHSVFKQEWQLVPLLARTVCVMDETDVPYQRIDFKLLKSDVFNCMDGDWEFTPMNGDGKVTRLTLNVNFQISGPGPKPFAVAFARKKLHQRLEHIKELAERARTELDVNASLMDKDSR